MCLFDYWRNVNSYAKNRKNLKKETINNPKTSIPKKNEKKVPSKKETKDPSKTINEIDREKLEEKFSKQTNEKETIN